jgi:hypothetical protein
MNFFPYRAILIDESILSSVSTDYDKDFYRRMKITSPHYHEELDWTLSVNPAL